MRTLRAHYPLSLLCRALEVSRSGYYAWQHRRPSKRAQENARLEVAIQATLVRTRQTYGSEHLQAELRADGFPAGIGCIIRLRKKLGLRRTQVRRFTLTTDSAHHLPVADNLLAQTFTTTRPNETWITAITYVPTAECPLRDQLRTTLRAVPNALTGLVDRWRDHLGHRRLPETTHRVPQQSL